MDDLAARYAPMIEQLAEMYAHHPVAHAQLRSLVVTREEWDNDEMCGGHFWFEVSGPAELDDSFQIDARADDADGATIDIIIHAVNGMLNWGEWFRNPLLSDGENTRIQQWPPLSVIPNPPWKS